MAKRNMNWVWVVQRRRDVRQFEQQNAINSNSIISNTAARRQHRLERNESFISSYAIADKRTTDDFGFGYLCRYRRSNSSQWLIMNLIKFSTITYSFQFIWEHFPRTKQLYRFYLVFFFYIFIFVFSFRHFITCESFILAFRCDVLFRKKRIESELEKKSTSKRFDVNCFECGKYLADYGYDDFIVVSATRKSSTERCSGQFFFCFFFLF